MHPEENRRREGRIYTDFTCLCAAVRQRGRGRIQDISPSGCLIVDSPITPCRGELVGLTFDHKAGNMLLIGWVVRHVDNGFAIEFDHLEPDSLELIKTLESIVPTSRRRLDHED